MFLNCKISNLIQQRKQNIVVAAVKITWRQNYLFSCYCLKKSFGWTFDNLQPRKSKFIDLSQNVARIKKRTLWVEIVRAMQTQRFLSPSHSVPELSQGRTEERGEDEQRRGESRVESSGAGKEQSGNRKAGARPGESATAHPRYKEMRATQHQRAIDSSAQQAESRVC